MKKIISLTALALMLCMVFAACAKEPDPVFVGMDMESKITIVRTSDGSIAYEGTPAYNVADAYNQITSIEKFDEEKDADAEWIVVIMCTYDDPATSPSLFRLSYLGNNEFNVKVQGSDKQQYKVVSEALYHAFAEPVLAH